MVTKRERLVYEQVLERDRLSMWGVIGPGNNHGITRDQYMASNPWVCAAVIVDPSRWGTCSGAMERDHVWEHAGGTKSKRPPTTMETLVILCHHHHQNGWATSHRPEIREYIKKANEQWRTIGSTPTG